MIPLLFILGIPAALALYAKKSAAPAQTAAASAASPAAQSAVGYTPHVSASTEAAPLFSTPAMEALYQNANYARAQLGQAQPRKIPVRPARPVFPRMSLPRPPVVTNPRLIVAGRAPIAMVGTGGRFRASIL